MTPSSSAASRTVRAMAPTCESVGAAETGNTGTRPNCALMPKRPQSADGMRTEPPPSVPSAKGVSPAATLAPAPPLEPPGVFARFHGLRVMPLSGLSQTALQPNSLVADLPTMQPPACSDPLHRGRIEVRHVVGEGPGAEGPGHARHRHQVLDREGDAGDRARLALRRAPSPAPRAAASATSGVRVTKALIWGSSASCRASVSSTSSTGEMLPAASRRLSSSAVM